MHNIPGVERRYVARRPSTAQHHGPWSRSTRTHRARGKFTTAVYLSAIVLLNFVLAGLNGKAAAAEGGRPRGATPRAVMT